MKATEELKKEHQAVKLMLQILGAISEKMVAGKKVSQEEFKPIIEFLTIFVDKCHHGKEEDFLFPTLEAVGIPREGGPIGVMLDEHNQGRELVAKLKAIIDRFTAGEQTAAKEFQSVVEAYITLLTQHIDKENNILYVMADEKLSSAKNEELFQAFEQLEQERIGPGKHKEFHTLLNNLKQEYLT